MRLLPQRGAKGWHTLMRERKLSQSFSVAAKAVIKRKSEKKTFHGNFLINHILIKLYKHTCEANARTGGSRVWHHIVFFIANKDASAHNGQPGACVCVCVGC